MINKQRYIDILAQILNEHYDEIKRKDTESKDRQQYICLLYTSPSPRD